MNVEIGLASHDDENIRAISRFGDLVRERLDESDEMVCFFIEQVDWSVSEAQRFEVYVAGGMLPSVARFACEDDLTEEQRRHFLKDGADGVVYQGTEDDNSYVTSELRQLDSISQDYTDGNGNSRLLVMTEYNYHPLRMSQEVFVSGELEIGRLVGAGQFEEAAELAHTFARFVAEDCRVREAAIAERIAQLDGNIGTVFIKFGSSHTGFRQEFQRLGIKPNLHFLDKEDWEKSYWFNGLSHMIRAYRFNKDLSLTDLDVYRALLGHRLEALHQAATSLGVIDSMEQDEFGKLERDFMLSFRDLDDIERIRRDIISYENLPAVLSMHLRAAGIGKKIYEPLLSFPDW